MAGATDENAGQCFLEDFDSYMDDINVRLTITRMVNDAVTMGIVKAFELDAAERMAAKELEAATMNGAMSSKVSMGLQVASRKANGLKQWLCPGLSVKLEELGGMRESLNTLGHTAKELFVKLKQEIDQIKCSSSEFVGLDCIFHGIALNKTLQTLGNTLDATFVQADHVASLSHEFCGEIENVVTKASIDEEFEENSSDRNNHFCGCQAGNFDEKLSALSNLRQELDAISKSLSMPEIVHSTVRHVSSEEGNDPKRADHFLPKVFNVSASSSPENFESPHLLQIPRIELQKYFKTEMTEMKRNHESKLQEMTEEYFSLKREFLNERELLQSLKKDKDFDMLRKKLLDTISRLECIIVEHEKPTSFNSNTNGNGNFKCRLEALLLENHELKGSLAVERKKVSQHCFAKESLLKTIDTLTDARIEDFIREDVNKCVFREVAGQINSATERFDLESFMMEEIYRLICEEAIHKSGCGIEDANLESDMMQELCTLIFIEAFNGAGKEVENERERFELASREIHGLRALVSQQQASISSSREELDLRTRELIDAMEIVERHKVEAEDLNQKLELAMKQSTKAEEERKALLAVVQQKNSILASVQAKEIENRKKLESAVVHVYGLLKAISEFECTVAEAVKLNSCRLQDSCSKLNYLIHNASTLRKTGALFKKKFEKTYSDLQKAEAEVDLLGDEVDVLSSLMEKLYLGLDHYSPILQHYSGIMEILKLIRIELCVEGSKQV